ncbi:hypothetical protein G6F29_012897 [Rhizopus arrhizus]|nr:hypothetical protein G6F23_012625 [Rhizopus arrhizus]KAG0973343.1 hypothetical protein G6F29_012897 [Rhizopus arrhizus]KAG1077280.1 hypothetical protein G6F42_024951 [Rhizopus arrhizus]KAG1199010.1 hypothetical protein G6F35_012562 [Rhizopus arrhizus]KAG1393958.1 hypothetical protein G6F58_012210 [Rhizopus delemar]
MAAEKLLSVAAGIVRFDSDGIATIKLANLSTQFNIINKDQRVAFLEYLPSSPDVFPVTSTTSTEDLHAFEQSANASKPNPKPSFSDAIDSSLPVSENARLANLLSEFDDCFKSKATSVTPLTQHHVDTGDHRPLSQPPHRTSAAENDVISNLIDEMLQQGIIQPSKSPWSSPVVLVRKKDGTPRFCIDYRRLNAITTRDVYPLPRIDDTLHSLGNAKFFSALDLTSSYWQIQLDEESKPKSAFVCR